MSTLKSLTSSPPIQYTVPLLFLLFGFAVGLPQLLFWALTHPSDLLSTPPSTLLTALRHRLFALIYTRLSPLMDPVDAPIKTPLLARAHGTVLEVGPGTGDNIKYYDRAAVRKLVLVEPNAHLHAQLRAHAARAGFREDDGSLQLLGCGASADGDFRKLRAAGLSEESVDTVVLVHVMCGIPAPAQSIEMYRRMLRRGGTLVFYEHVANDEDGSGWTRWVQGMYTRTVWWVFDGCQLDRETGGWIVDGVGRGKGVLGKEMGRMVGGKREVRGSREGRWREFVIEVPKDQAKYTCMPHVYGWAVKE